MRAYAKKLKEQRRIQTSVCKKILKTDKEGGKNLNLVFIFGWMFKEGHSESTRSCGSNE